jgi:hypothetical protein
MISTVLILLLQLGSGIALQNPPPPSLLSVSQFNLYNIKTPQLIGILIGCLVFVVTISVVIYLLYASGTLSRAFEEIQSGNNNSGPSKGRSLQNRSVTPYSTQPELYEHLLAARSQLTKRLSIPKLEGSSIVVKGLESNDIPELFSALNGSPQYDESEYDPVRIWGWIDPPRVVRNPEKEEESIVYPWMSLDSFREYLNYLEKEQEMIIIVIIEKEYKKPIGFIALASNSPTNLSIRFGNSSQFSSISDFICFSFFQILFSSLQLSKGRSEPILLFSLFSNGSFQLVTKILFLFPLS